ncbi:MAG: ATP-binding protein [Melioribacteraceae bacterium]|nr:ATP-binding protein [Melioribacteraceae bacterium]
MRGIRSDRSRILLVDTLIFIACLVGIFNIAQKADLPFQTANQNSKLIINKLEPTELFFKEGDIISTIQEYELKSKEEVEIFLESKTPGEEVDISVLRSNELLSGNVKLVNYYSLQYTIIAFLVGLAFFIVAIVVLLKCTNLELAKVCHWSFILTAMIILMTWGNYTILPLKLGVFSRMGSHLGYLFAPLFFLRFSFLFPSNLKQINKRWMIFLYILAALLFLILSIVFFLYSLKIDLALMRIYILLFDISSIFVGLLIILAISVFIHTYSTTKIEKDRKKLRWIILGFIIGPLSYLIFWVIPTRIRNVPILPEEIVLLLVAFVPITFGIAIIKYRLMNIDLIFRRSIVYSSVIALLLIIYALIVIVTTKLLNLQDSEVASIFAAVVIALLFQPAKLRVQKFVDRKFFRIQYDYRTALNKFYATIKDIHTEKELVDKTLTLIDNIIPLYRLGYFKYDENLNVLELIEHKNLESEESKVKFYPNDNNLFIKPISSPNKIEHGADFADVRIDEMSYVDPELIFNIISSKNKIHGLLILGGKMSDTQFTAEDIDLLKTITARLSLTLDRIKLQEEVILEHLEAERLEELNRLKSFFVSSVSHDLKTPLTSIKLFAERLKMMKETQSDKAIEYLNIIEGESDRLTRLINNVLDYSKIEKGILKYQLKEIDLVIITRRVIKNMEYQFKINKFIINEQYKIDKMIVDGDEDAVSEALINLLSNSIKYSDEAKKIDVVLDKRDHYYLISVRDYGQGIPKNDMNNIFNPFYRIKEYERDKAGGAGLGLAIVKYIIDSHNGKIELESEEGKGSKFTILFPMRNLDEQNNDN